MTNAEYEKAAAILMNGAISVQLNMSDTFAFATADGEEMDMMDFDKMIPLILKYGYDALVAYVAVKRGQEPIDCSCNHKNERYCAAKAEIEKMKGTLKYFMGHYKSDEGTK